MNFVVPETNHKICQVSRRKIRKSLPGDPREKKYETDGRYYGPLMYSRMTKLSQNLGMEQGHYLQTSFTNCTAGRQTSKMARPGQKPPWEALIILVVPVVWGVHLTLRRKGKQAGLLREGQGEDCLKESSESLGPCSSTLKSEIESPNCQGDQCWGDDFH
jgi:hypothetical protein